MPMMKSPYTHQLISLTGHSVEFEANVPVWVPESLGLAAECLALGAVMVSDEPVPEVVAPDEKSDNDDDAEAEFKAALDAALTKILVRDDPDDLKADMTPKVVKVVTEMSPDLRRASATEVSEAYQRLQENIDLAE